MVERMARAPEVMADIRNRAGVTVTRGVANPAVLEARRNYVEARELSPSADITPELDLFVVLYEERQYVQAKNVLQDMQKRAPDDPVVNELAQRLEKALRVE
jgi:Tfp pilus assembly protein PilF